MDDIVFILEYYFGLMGINGKYESEGISKSRVFGKVVVVVG